MTKHVTVFIALLFILIPAAIFAQVEEVNLFNNWEFDEGEDGWSFVINADAEASHSPDEEGFMSGPCALCWDIVNGGPNFWDVQTYQTAPIVYDVEYFIDFLVYYEPTTSDQLNVYVKWELAQDPYTQYHYEQFVLDEPYQIHRVQSTLISTVDDSTANLKIFLGNPNMEVKVWLDRIYVGDYALDELVGVEDQLVAKPAPVSFALQQNYPNPFNPATQISYSLGEPAQVTLQVYNQLGQLITTLAEGKQARGTYTVQWNGLDNSGVDVASGVYFVKMTAIGNNQNYTGFIKAIKLK